jgi:CheY-like chemotaxis protein
MHGGRIEGHSGGLGKGSTFRVFLPLLDAAQGPPAEPAAAAATRAVPGLRVLVADDNWDAAASLALLLESAGHDVRVVHDGLEAVRAVGAWTPEVAVRDLGMPGLNGYAAARRIRDAGEPGGGCPVLIALTGWGQDEDRRRSAAAGFDHHLVKPVAPAALLELLKSPRRAPC